MIFTSEMFQDNPLGTIHKIPFLSSSACDNLVHKACLVPKWTTKRHKNFPTYDIPLGEIDDLDFSKELLQISDLCMKTYDLIGTINLYDTFVVKYEKNGQDCLNIHRDSSEISFILALSDPSDFTGGGTFYESHDKTIIPNKGEIVFHCGKLRHGGNKIESGIRFILIGFFHINSTRIRKVPSFESVSNSISDRRYLDYLYCHDTLCDVKLYIKIINIPQRQEKLKNILKQIQRLHIPDGWTVDTQVVVANEGIGHHGYKKWRTSETFGHGQHITKYWNREVTRGEIGCTLSHLSAINSVILGENEFLLIFEDDATFYSDLLFRIDHCIRDKNYWDIIDLGGVSINDVNKQLSNYHYELGHTYKAHCILYNKYALSKLQEININDRLIVYDELLPLLRRKSERMDLRNLYNDIDELVAVYPYQQMSHQIGNIHDTENVSPLNIFSRIQNDYDMINFYIFKNITTNQNIMLLINTANKSLWKFQIDNVEQCSNVENGWKIYITTTIKLVAVHLNNDSSSVTFQHNDRSLHQKNSFVVFPSYLSVKIQNSTVWFANGSPFY